VSVGRRRFRILATLIRLVVGATFIAASYGKILEPESFAQSVYYYHMVPASLLHLFAIILPWMELLAGLALVLGPKRRGAALLAIVMTVLFMIGLSSALVRDLDISCGCFGTEGGHAVGSGLLLRDGAMLLALLLFLLLERSSERRPLD